MNKPLIRYLVSSPHGDIPADEHKWDLPLEGDASETPYRIYFDSIREFLSKDEFRPFLSLISKKNGRRIFIDEVNELIIRTEKHGLFYHPASIEFILKQGKVKFGLNVAISDMGRHWLKEELNVLQKLHEKYGLPYLPKVYLFGEFNDMSFLLEDWFEGYHEFHISKYENGSHGLKLWDFCHGYKYLSPEQSFEIYKQTSKILTLYYDLDDFSEIFPWHHAAGDFVVKIVGENNKPPLPPFNSPLTKGGHRGVKGEMRGFSGKTIDVRLTTARRYKPFIGFLGQDTLNPILALCYYLLNLTIRMRLDKLDGLGEVVWIDHRCVEATLRGFFEALTVKDLRNSVGNVEEFLTILQSFNADELKILVSPLLEQYRKTGDFPAVTSNLDSHIQELYSTLQTLP
jgi:hypothetical protein